VSDLRGQFLPIHLWYSCTAVLNLVGVLEYTVFTTKFSTKFSRHGFSLERKPMVYLLLFLVVLKFSIVLHFGVGARPFRDMPLYSKGRSTGVAARGRLA
jgi:hypothetical protein